MGTQNKKSHWSLPESLHFDVVGEKEYPEARGDVGQDQFAVWPVDGVEVVNYEPALLLLAVGDHAVELQDPVQVTTSTTLVQVVIQTDIPEIG